MIKFFSGAKALAAGLGILLATPIFAERTADYEVVPLPHKIEPLRAKPFVLDSNTVITYTEGNKDLQKNAVMLSGYLKQLTGLNLKIKGIDAKEKAGNAIRLSASLNSENKEAYTITADSDGIVIDGASPAGNFYGIQTLRKSIPADREESVVFPAVRITDAPEFSYRGAHLDVSRHFFPADSVKKYIDMMALHNMNRFHWHLTDDQGWRLPLSKHPELITKGSVRRGTCVGNHFSTLDSVPYGGFFTPAEIKEVIDYAADHYISIIPEIDLPGHMLAALTAHPELGCTGGPYELWTRWGVSEDVLCAGNPEVYNLISDVLTEVAEIFPFEYVHIGGDECPKERWKECAKCQAKIAELGLKDDEHSSKEEKLQSYVMSFASDVLSRKGKKIIGWDEIIEGGLPEGAVVMSWQGSAGGRKAAALGHDAIMTPNSHYYLDYYQTKDREHEPFAIGGYNPLSKCYSYNPYEGIPEAERHHILGVQGNLWTEYIHTFPHVQYMALPRWSALSEVQWSAPESRDFETFKGRLTKLKDHYRMNGYNYSIREE